jgi:Flp pilus assembly protein TadG
MTLQTNVKNGIFRLARSERGTSLVEFAIVLPVLCFLLIGMIDFGRAMYFGIVASNAARAGAQYGAQYLWTVNDSAGITSAVAQDAPNMAWTVTTQAACSINGSAIVPCPNMGTAQPNTVYYVKVHVSGSFPLLVNYPGLPASIPINAENVTRVATQ